VRAGRFVVLNEPKPGHATLSPFLVLPTTVSKKAPIVRLRRRTRRRRRLPRR
jgi:hypothetical protein